MTNSTVMLKTSRSLTHRIKRKILRFMLLTNNKYQSNQVYITLSIRTWFMIFDLWYDIDWFMILFVITSN